MLTKTERKAVESTVWFCDSNYQKTTGFGADYNVHTCNQ